MATDLLRRRRQMMAQGDEFAGWTIGKCQRYYPTILDFEDCMISPPIEIPEGCERLSYHMPTDYTPDASNCNWLFDANMEHLRSDLWTRRWRNSTVNRNDLNWKYITLSLPISVKDDCYILDITNNVYLWKGKNV